MAIFLAKKIIGTRVGMSFLLAQLVASIMFGIIYYIQDIFIYNYIDYAKSINIVSSNFNMQTHQHKSLLYWMWLSVIMQSTVGNNLPFDTTGNYIYPIINIIQLISIFGITAFYV